MRLTHLTSFCPTYLIKLVLFNYTPYETVFGAQLAPSIQRWATGCTAEE
jgi:hypothetical protein